MDIGPLLPGRMPNSLVTQRLQEQMDAARFGLSQLEQEISTGQKFQLPSEDPIDAAHAIQLQSLLTQNTQLDSNVQASTSLLNATDAALATIAGALNTARGLVTAGIGDASSPEQKAGMAEQVQALITQVVNTGNSIFSGRYLFGGSQ